MTTRSGLGPLNQDTTIDMGGVKYKLKAGEVAELTITGAEPDEIDVERLKVDGGYWGECGASPGDAHYCTMADEFRIGLPEDACEHCIPRPPAKDDDGPDLYMCPALCGCLWRDNNDGTMSLYGQNSKSCDICEPMFLNQLIPLMATRPIKTKEQKKAHGLAKCIDSQTLMGWGKALKVAEHIISEGWGKEG